MFGGDNAFLVLITAFSFTFRITLHATGINANSYTAGIFAEGYIVFVFPFVCSFVHSCVRHVR